MSIELFVPDEVDCGHVGCNLANRDEVANLSHPATVEDVVAWLVEHGAEELPASHGFVWVDKGKQVAVFKPGRYLVFRMEEQ